MSDYHSTRPANAGNETDLGPSEGSGDSTRIQDLLEPIDPTDPIERVRRPPAEKGEKGSSTIAVAAAIIGNILVGIVKFIAAGLSGSQAMVSEGIHSIVDSGNGILVLFIPSVTAKNSTSGHWSSLFSSSRLAAASRLSRAFRIW